MVFGWFRSKKPDAQSAPASQGQAVRFWRRQALEAALIKACTQCNAPGIYKSEARIKEGWPGCYVEPGDERDEQPVGDVCPNCHHPRPYDQALGEIWKKEYN